MEGAGVYAATNYKKTEWIVVKAICDFADGNKSDNKKLHQEIAIKSAVNLSIHVFSSQHAFSDLGFLPIETII